MSFQLNTTGVLMSYIEKVVIIVKGEEDSSSSGDGFWMLHDPGFQKVILAAALVFVAIGAYYGYQDGGGVDGAMRWAALVLILGPIAVAICISFFTGLLILLLILLGIGLVMNILVFLVTGHFM